MQKKIYILVISAVAVFILGILVGYKVPKKTLYNGQKTPDTFQAGWNAAKLRVSQYLPGSDLNINSKINEVSGVIQAIDGNKLTIKINQFEPLSDPSLDNRIVIVGSNTKILNAFPKDPVAFQKEMQDFQKKVTNVSGDSAANPINSMVPPKPFEEKEATISNLKIAQSVNVTSNDDIRSQKQFSAAQISIQNDELKATTPDNIQ